MATRPTTSGICRLCRRPGATRQVVFRQNVGVVLLRFTKKVEGPLCRGCIESAFSSMTLTTFFAGWWGLVSFFATPFILVSNILEYTKAVRSLELRNVASPATGRRAIVAIAALTALAVVGAFSVVAVAIALVARTPARTRQASRGTDGGADGLRQAEAKILAYQGTAAFGNTPEAESYAAAFSEKMALVRRSAFTGGRDENAPSLTEGRFLTYCEVRQGRVCFLVHVPELRSYAPSARAALGETAWAVARQTVESRPDVATLRLGVGLRGVLLYGVVMTGPAHGGTPPTVDDPAPLEAFFSGPLAAAPIETTRLRPPETPAPTPEPTPALSLAERLKRDIDTIGLSEFEPRHAAEQDLESLGLEAVPALLETAQDPTKNVQARATSMHLLGKSGSPRAVPVLLRCLEDRGAGHAAGEGLRYVKDAETAVLPLLAQGIEKRCRRPLERETPAAVYCSNAIDTLGRFGRAASFAAPVVVKVLTAQPPEAGAHVTAITAAGNIGPAAKDAVPFMIAGLKHSETYFRQESIRALGRIGPAAAAALPALEELRRTHPGYQGALELEQALASIRGGVSPPR